MQYLDPLNLETMPDLQVKEYFKMDQEWLQKMKDLNPEGYAKSIEDWKAHEEDAKFWRDFETQKMSSKLTNEGWSQQPTLVIPALLRRQMELRFGPQWGAFNFLRYGIWYHYPKLRTTSRYHAKKKGISKQHITEGFNK